MHRVISTDDYAVEERFDAWVDVVARALVPVDVDVDEPHAYRAGCRQPAWARPGSAP